VYRDAPDPALHALRVLHGNTVGRGPVAEGEREAGPVGGDAGIDPEAVALEVEAEDRLQPDAVQPARRAGVPGPAAAAGVRRHPVDVGGDDVGLDAVAGDAIGRGGVADRVEEVEQLGGAVAAALEGSGEHDPGGRVRVLAAVLPDAGDVALDVARLQRP